ncbi:MAG: DNA polymerase III subunit delta [Bacteroidales bacterium]|nr:DNA polymerase III subunit delta [Bacteroidales bacterium]MBS3774029.1 DNA polymerase III subunit delta [Bacteroidales bacterium]
MEYNQILDELKNKIYRPVYLFHGEEPYFIDKLTQFIQDNVLSESEKSFNQTILYGKDTDAGTVINTAKRYPMMSSHQVVILKEAQTMKEINDLYYYLEKPQKSTILVISHKYKTLDKRTKLFKSLQKNGVVFESKKIPDYRIPEWIAKYLEHHKKSINNDAAMLITEYLGNDLNKVAHELDKLLLTLPEKETTITTNHVETNIGISKDYNPFELNKALAEKDVLKANRIILHFGKNPNEYPIPLIIGSLYFFFSKLLGYHFLTNKNKKQVASTLKVYPNMTWQYEKAAKKYNYQKVARIISYLREYDLKSKGLNNVSATQGELLKELIFKILH